MKIGAVLSILSVFYIASTEQAAVSAGMRMYPNWSRKEMEQKAQRGMIETNNYAMAYPGAAEAQFDVPTNLQELHQCANQECKEVCVPCPVGTTCCGTFFGHCVCIRPKMGNCCTTDPVCYVKKEACVLALKALEKIPG